MKKVYIHADEFCIRKLLDAKKMAEYFYKNNYIITDGPDDADIIIFFSCALLNDITEYSLNKVKEFQKYDAELIVTGDLPETDKEKLSEIFSGRTIATKDLDKIDEFFPDNKVKFSNIGDANLEFHKYNKNRNLESIKKFLRKIKFLENTCLRTKLYILRHLINENSIKFLFLAKTPLYHIRIARGCIGKCLYCPLKQSIGTLKSKPISKCIEEFKKGLQEGYKHFAITADDTGPYGIDIGTNLPKLLNEITTIQGDYDVVIQSLNAQWAVKYIDDLEEIVRRGKIIRMGIPIQSGSSRVLKLMHRYSDVDKMKDAFLRLKKSYPKLSLFTDCIVGFPTETEKDCKQNLSFIKEAKFDDVFLYEFSCKVGTEAEKIEPKISDEEISRRFKYSKKYLQKIGCFIIYVPKRS